MTALAIELLVLFRLWACVSIPRMVERSACDGSQNRTAVAPLIQTVQSVYNRCTVVEITLKTTNEIESDWIKCHEKGSIERTNYRTSDRETRTKRIETDETNPNQIQTTLKRHEFANNNNAFYTAIFPLRDSVLLRRRQPQARLPSVSRSRRHQPQPQPQALAVAVALAVGVGVSRSRRRQPQPQARLPRESGAITARKWREASVAARTLSGKHSF